MIETLTPFIDAATSMPTLLFSVMMVPVMLYWALAVFGLFSLDWLDSADAAEGVLDGAADGVLDSAADGLLDGAADSVLDHAADGLLDHAADGVLDHATDGLLDHAVDGVLDHVVDGAADGLHEIGVGGDLAHPADGSPRAAAHHSGFGQIPKSIVGSFLIGFGWIFSLLGSLYLPGFQDLANRGLWVGAILALGTCGLAFGATMLALRPLSRSLVATLGPTRRDLIGRFCVVKTIRVDASSGQAEADDGQLVQVRTRQGKVFEYGQRVLIFDYDSRGEIFYVSEVEGALAEPDGPERGS